MKSNLSLGFCSVLTIVFVIAKILGYIGWSWWICFLPIIIGWAVVIGMILLVIAFKVLDNEWRG